MTADNLYGGVRTLIIENNSALSSNLRASLADQGMRDLIVGNSLNSVIDAVENEVLDLIICDATLLGPDFPAVTQSIRQNKLGKNPFVVIIASVYDAEEHKVREVLNGGVDDLLSRPAPSNLMVERIGNFVKARKPFVTTSSYVGPTRRKNVRIGDESSNLMQVPNTLYSKLIEKMEFEELQRMIDGAIARLEERQAENPLSGINRLIRHVLAGCHPGSNKEHLTRDLRQLIDVSRELSLYHRGTAFDHVADLATATANLAERILQNPTNVQPMDLQLLSKLAEVTGHSVTAQQVAAEPIREMAQGTAGFAGLDGLDLR